ncbi:hypothetical protein [Pedobacter sp. GR22-6]|uniref:hypothetical protein n=1 Tax=Pedobacter sp. GR22-6 TaxID=3127957 RepID=UPI00307F4E6E
MKLPLRIHFEGQDYSYTILNNTLDRSTMEFRISMADQQYTLVRNEKNEWSCVDLTIGDNPDLLIAIARNIGLRYKL